MHSKYQQNNCGKLLIVLLTKEMKGLPHISAGPLVLKHAQKHIALHGARNSAFVIADQSGNIRDIKDVALENNKEYLIKNTPKATKSVEKLLPNIKHTVSSLNDNHQYDKILVIGSPGIALTLEMANSLKEFNSQRLKKNGLIRFQICTFKYQEIINHKEKNFVNEVTPSGCKLSIPEMRSIVSESDTRAVDLYDNTFHVLKKPLKNVLKQKNSNEKIRDEIKSTLLLNNNQNETDELIQSIKFIQENGEEIIPSQLLSSALKKIEEKAVQDLIALCDKYIAHLDKQKNRIEGSSQIKLDLVNQMKICLKNDKINESNTAKIENFNKFLIKENRINLGVKRDNDWIRFCAAVGRILACVTLVLIPLTTKMGSLRFFNTHGENFFDNAKDIVSNIGNRF